MGRFTWRTYLLIAATLVAALPMLVLGAGPLLGAGAAGLAMAVVLAATILVQSVNEAAYDEGDLELLGAIANETAVGIERSELYEETADLSRRLFELHRVGLEINSERDTQSVAERMSSVARDLLRSSAVAVYLEDRAR